MSVTKRGGGEKWEEREGEGTCVQIKQRHDIQQNDTQHSSIKHNEKRDTKNQRQRAHQQTIYGVALLCIVHSQRCCVKWYYARCRYAEYRYAEYCYAEYHYAEYHYAE